MSTIAYVIYDYDKERFGLIEIRYVKPKYSFISL